MCHFTTLKFWCGHAEKAFISSCDTLGCIPFCDEYPIFSPCRACSAPVVEPLHGFDIPDAELASQEHMASNNLQNNAFGFPNPPVNYWNVDPQLIEQNETEAADYNDPTLFPNWVFPDDINAITDYMIPPYETGEAAQAPVEEQGTLASQITAEFEYPSPPMTAWNMEQEEANLQSDLHVYGHGQTTSKYTTPAVGGNAFEDSDALPQTDARFKPKELSPTPGAREFGSYLEAAGETLDKPISWLGVSLQDYIDAAESVDGSEEESERPQSPKRPIPPPDFSRDYHDFPAAETLGIEKPSRINLPILKKKVQRGKLEAVLRHEDIKQEDDDEPELPCVPLIERRRDNKSVFPAFSSDSTITMYSTTSSTKSIRPRRRRKAFRLTTRKYAGKKRPHTT